MRNRKTALLAWAFCGIAFASVVFGLALEFVNRNSYGSAMAFVSQAVWRLAPIAFAFPAALVVSRQPRNTIGWLLVIPAVMLIIGVPLEPYLKSITAADLTPTPMLLLLAWFSGFVWLPMLISILLILLLFPSGRPPSPRWRWVGYAAICWAAVFALIASLADTIELGGQVFPNPLGLIPSELGNLILGPWQIGLVVLVLLSLAAFIVRYRRGTATEREQIKWLLYACGVFVAVFIAGFAFNLGGSETTAGYIWGTILSLTLMSIPIVIAIAVLRYRLWDIDVIIRRTLIYGALTLALALVYFGSVVLLQSLFTAVSGQSSTLALVISTLGIAALFTPLRRRIQRDIDRRFYRKKYDAEQTLAAFAATARDEVELENLAEALLSVVQETIQPEQAWLWLKER